MRREFRHFKHRSFFKRFFVSFLLGLLLPVVLLSTLFKSFFFHSYSDSVIEQNQVALERFATQFDANLQSCNAIAKQMANLSDFSPRTLTSNPIAYDRITKVINGYLVSQTFFSDIHFYSSCTPNTIYTASGTYNPRYYYRYGEMFTTVDDLTVSDKSACWALAYATDKDGQVRRIAQYIVPVPNTNGGFCLFTLSEDAFASINFANGALGEIYWNDLLLYPSEPLAQPANTSELRVSSPASRLTYIQFIPTDTMLTHVNQLDRLFTWCIAAVVILSGIIIYFLSVTNYKPIKRLSMMAEQALPMLPPNMNEMDSIGFAITQLKSEKEQQQLRDTQEKLLLQTLYGRYEDREAHLRDCSAAGLDFSGQLWRAALVALDDANVCLPDMEAMARSILGTDYDAYCLEIVPVGYWAILLGMEKDDTALLHSKLGALIESVSPFCAGNASIYVGGLARDITGINASMHEAMLQQCMVGNTRSGVNVYVKQSSGSPETPYPRLELEALSVALADGDAGRVQMYTDILLECATASTRLYSRQAICYDIINAYVRSFEELRPGVPLEDVRRPAGELCTADTIHMYFDIIMRLEKQMLELLQSVPADRAPEAEAELKANTIAQWIDSNPNIGELTASDVADHFGISISNLSHRFKAETHRTISEYLSIARIEYAKQLLEDSDLTITQIAARLKYSQLNNFTRFFKRIVGMPPSEYREKHARH